jgi:arginine exporter protein ArgO
VFVINLALVTYGKFGTGSLAQLAGVAHIAVLVLGLVFTVWYPDYIQKKNRAQPSGSS